MSEETTDEFKEWMQHPFTQRFWRLMFFCRERNKEDWAKGMQKGQTIEEWALKNSEALGEVQALEHLLGLDMEGIITLESAANEYIRDKSRWLDGAG